MESGNRRPTLQEIALIDFLIATSAISVPIDWKERLFVHPMDDGGMGSLLLLLVENIGQHRQMGRRVSEYLFKDLDGVDVLASLNVDTEGDLFELDMWKMDYSPLISFPSFDHPHGG